MMTTMQTIQEQIEDFSGGKEPLECVFCCETISNKSRVRALINKANREQLQAIILLFGK